MPKVLDLASKFHEHLFGISSQKCSESRGKSWFEEKSNTSGREGGQMTRTQHSRTENGYLPGHSAHQWPSVSLAVQTHPPCQGNGIWTTVTWRTAVGWWPVKTQSANPSLHHFPKDLSKAHRCAHLSSFATCSGSQSTTSKHPTISSVLLWRGKVPNHSPQTQKVCLHQTRCMSRGWVVPPTQKPESSSTDSRNRNPYTSMAFAGERSGRKPPNSWRRCLRYFT